MLLSITTQHQPATDLGYLLHKHPDRCQASMTSFGKAYVFYPVATHSLCTASLLLDIDPVAMVRGKKEHIGSGPFNQYVSDRPYVASSFLSVAIATVFGTALNGRCPKKPELVDKAIPLNAKLSVVPLRGGEKIIHELFEPLGYEIKTMPHMLDDHHKSWGESIYVTLTLSAKLPLKDLLTHLYVLIPVLDNKKHYYVGEAELDKLLTKGKGWLLHHPKKEFIAKRYLKHKLSLARLAHARLMEENEEEKSDPVSIDSPDTAESLLEKPLSLNETRINTVTEKILKLNAQTVIDLGCGEGKLLKALLKQRSILKVSGTDVSIRSLEIAHRKIGIERLSEKIRDKISLFHGSLMYRDDRFNGFDVAVVMEVIEHLEIFRLKAFERVLFEYARPKTVIVTTPNIEYNTLWEIEDGALRHHDHRFEWDRKTFTHWCESIAENYRYTAAVESIGPIDEKYGAPTQMGVLSRAD